MSRLSPGSIIVVIFAILFGLAGAYSVKAYLKPAPVEQAEAPRAVATVEPASATLPLGMDEDFKVSMTFDGHTIDIVNISGYTWGANSGADFDEVAGTDLLNNDSFPQGLDTDDDRYYRTATANTVSLAATRRIAVAGVPATA